VRLALFCTTVGLLAIGSWRTAPGLVCGTVVLAIGIALGTPSIMVLALQNAPAAERGAVMGTVSMSLDVALGLGPAMFGLVAATADRGTGFLAAAVVAGCGLALAAARLTGTVSGVALERPPTSGPLATRDARSEQAGHRPVSAS
jgi:MFS family permease